MATIQHYLADPDVRRAAWRSRNENPAFQAEPNVGPRGDRRAGAPGQAARRRDPERRRPAPEGRHRRRAGRRGPRHDLVDALLGLPGPPADGRDAGPGARPARRTRRARCAAGSSRATRSRSARRSCPRSSTGRCRSARSATCCSPSARRCSVYPAANCVPRAKAAGARVVIVNGGPTEMDGLADAVLQRPDRRHPAGPRRCRGLIHPAC